MKPLHGRVTYKYIEVGKTLYQALSVGTPRFPPRAAYVMLNELFKHTSRTLSLYDPFCGNGVLLVTAYLLFSQQLKRVMGSDIQPIAVETARRNFQWLRDRHALQERVQAIQAYKTQNDELKGLYQKKCRRIFEHAQAIDLEVDIFEHDARRIDPVLASIDGDVAVVTDPPYSPINPQKLTRGIEPADFGPLEPFLQQVACSSNISSLMICYPLDRPILPLLETYFAVTPKRGTRGRSIYYCTRKPAN